MRRQIKDFVQVCASTIRLQGPVYEFGARQMDGQVGYADIRPFFQGMKFIGADYIEGPGVDVVIDLRQMDLPDDSIKTAFCLEVLEHVDDVQKAVSELHRVMASDGVLIISVPMNIRIHGSPHDYWRFTPEGLNHLLKEFEYRFIGSVGRDDYPDNILAVVSKHPIDLSAFKIAFADYSRRWTPHWYSVRLKVTPMARLVLPRIFLGDELELWLRRRKDTNYPATRQFARLLLPPILSRLWQGQHRQDP